MTEHGSSPSNLRYPAWQLPYEAALRELDLKKLLQRIYEAEAAIFDRLQELARSPDSPDHNAEKQAIADALGALRAVKRDKLNFPDWEKK